MVLKRLAERAEVLKETLKQQLYHSTGLSQEEWAALQARAAFDRGLATGLDFVCDLELEDIHDEPEREA